MFNPGDLARLRADLNDLFAETRSGALIGLSPQSVGGMTWTVSSVSGNTITGPANSTSTITGYVYPERPSGLSQAQPGVIVSDAGAWRFTVVSGTVQAGTLLVSAADPTWRFVVQGRAFDPSGLQTWLVNQQR